MNKSTIKVFTLMMALVLTMGLKSYSQCKKEVITSATELVISDLLDSKSGNTIMGNPKLVDSPYGKAVLFDGVGDAIFMDYNPLQGLKQFTIEVKMRPDSQGLTEQRFMHFGSVQGSRVMLETRLTENNQWYFDGFAKSGDSQLALIDPKLLHPLNEWAHIAFVFDNGDFSTFINGEKELNGSIEFTPYGEGKTAVGVRQNKVCWYKGAMYSILITPKALTPGEFTK